jgi:cob(I)alamin adenosyltransferase
MSAAEWQTGYVQVYTGDGKGKTTAALGLALRAAGAGLKVFIAQFIKGRHYSELAAVERLADCVTLRQFGRGCFIRREPAPEDIAAAQRGLDEARDVLAAGHHGLVILDEANVATQLGLFTADELLDLIESKPAHVELVITGRGAHPRVLERADLVTEMREIKHYYTRGVQARRGIEA